jgi:hypothetical protein
MESGVLNAVKSVSCAPLSCEHLKRHIVIAIATPSQVKSNELNKINIHNRSLCLIHDDDNGVSLLMIVLVR